MKERTIALYNEQPYTFDAEIYYITLIDSLAAAILNIRKIMETEYELSMLCEKDTGEFRGRKDTVQLLANYSYKLSQELSAIERAYVTYMDLKYKP